MSMLEDALRRFDLLCCLGLDEPTDSTIQRVVSEYPVLEASPKLLEVCEIVSAHTDGCRHCKELANAALAEAKPKKEQVQK